MIRPLAFWGSESLREIEVGSRDLLFVDDTALAGSPRAEFKGGNVLQYRPHDDDPDWEYLGNP